jgi:hypothetical protein
VSLLTVDQALALIATEVTLPDVQAVINREEAELVARYGAHYVDGATTITETPRGGGCNLYLKRRIGSVSSISEAASLDTTPTALASTAYYVWAGQGRITRLPEGTAWGRRVSVVYVPADDRELRRQVLLELVRLALEQTAMAKESVGGAYSYEAPEWESARRKLYKRLEFASI